jgi:predicted unusual protein kinase regulating ubiquinone biosynthesis (AarF/ABC1/UbiB family)
MTPSKLENVKPAIRPRLRLIRIYATTCRVVLSYWWLRAQRPLLGRERYAAKLVDCHRRNARRIHAAILTAGGLFIKVGQLISILSNFLPPEFRHQLQGLQDRLPPRPYLEIAGRLETELGARPDAVFQYFERTPIATASLAQVHAAALPDGRRVAVKVQHADIERVARLDLEVIRRLLAIVQFFTGVRGIESYHPEISRMIDEELDFTKETENIARIGAGFASDASVRCPTVVPEFSTRRVLTTEFIDGTKITDFEALSARGLDRRRLAERIVSAYCRMIFRDGVYHADPHPGNIFVGTDGAIVFVDFGAVGVLAPHMREGIPRFFEGVIRRDPQRITDAIRTMGFVARDPGSADVAARVIEYFQRKVFDELSEESFSLGNLQVDLRSRLETLADLRKLDVSLSQLTETFQVPKDWVLLERTLLLLLGLCTELDPSWNPMTVIEPYLEDVVLGEDRDWGSFLRAAVSDMARTAVTIPDDLQRVLTRANRGELEIRVPEIPAAARLVYAAAHQLIYTILGTASGVIAFQASERGHGMLAWVLAVIAALAFLSLAGSMRRAGRSKTR